MNEIIIQLEEITPKEFFGAQNNTIEQIKKIDEYKNLTNQECEQIIEQLEQLAESIASYEKSLEIKPDFEPARSRYTNLIAENSHAN